MTLFPALPHGPLLELVEVEAVPPLHFYVEGGHFQPIIRFHASDLEGMLERLNGAKVTEIHQDGPDDGCGRFFEVADPDGTWLQYHVNIGEAVIMEGTTEAAVNLEIPVKDVLRSAAFYESIGFTLEREPNAAIAFLYAGFRVDRFGYTNSPEFGIILSKRDDFPLMRFERSQAWEPVIALQTEDLASYHAKLLEKGIVVNEQYNENVLNSLLLSDPDGHTLQVRRCESNTHSVNLSEMSPIAVVQTNN